jgi:hypothetical protein
MRRRSQSIKNARLIEVTIRQIRLFSRLLYLKDVIQVRGDCPKTNN